MTPEEVIAAQASADVAFAKRQIAAWWDEKTSRKPLNWMLFEDVQRAIFRAAKHRALDAPDAMLLLDEALGAFTKRGTHLQTWDA